MTDAPARQGSIIGAALLVTASTCIAFTLGLLSNALAARALGPDDFGLMLAVVAAAIAAATTKFCAQPTAGFTVGTAYVLLFTLPSIRVGSWTSDDGRLVLEFAPRRPKRLGWTSRWIERRGEDGTRS